MKKNFKKLIRRIPLVASAAKVFYDWKKEKDLDGRVRKFLDNGELPFVKEPPDFYAVGHEPTIRCNLRCKMCYQGATRSLRQEELGTEGILTMYGTLKGRVKEIKLVGGEPFMRSDIFDLISFWDGQAARIILQTNCTLLDEEKVKKLKAFKNISDIATSLDGPADLHDMVRGVPGTFERLKKAIGLIKTHLPEVPITVFCTLLLWDNLDQLEKLIDTCKELWLGTINVLFEQVYQPKDVEAAKRIFKDTLGWPEDGWRLNTQIRESLFPRNIDSKKLKKRLAAIRRYGLRRNCFVNFMPFNYYKNLDKYLGETPVRPASPELQRGEPFCLKLLSRELRVNQEGNVIWCDIIEKPFGNLLKQSPDQIWLSEDYQKFREYLFKNSLPICLRCCKAHYINHG